MTYAEFSKMRPEEQLIYNHKVRNKGLIMPEMLVKEWASQTQGMLIRQLRKRGIGNTGALEQSIKQLTSGNAGIEKIVFTFLKYGIYMDMGVGRGRSLQDKRNKKFDNGINRLLGVKMTRSKPSKFRKKEDYQWYSKSLYGAIYKGLPKVLAEAYGREAAMVINIPNVYQLF